MKKALETKKGKLQSYGETATSVLILESDDIALTNHVRLYTAFLRAEKEVSVSIDQIWLAQSGGFNDEEPQCNFLCFRGPSDLMRAANPGNFMIHPDFEDYWWDHILEDIE
ncbi:MAG: hypothetical protein JRI41_08360 [Deltaproteobacteria bacterium]|nr:hypothetical protein [Deltaproteobacteria bacterium]